MKDGKFEASQLPEGRSVLSLNRVGRENAGTVIVCSAVNIVGSISTRVVLTINTQDDRPPPIIIEGPYNQTLPIKSMATLNCKAIGTPIPEILWYKDGSPVLPSDRINISETGLLTITNLNKNDDAGFYTCVASSKSGKSTWSAHLRLESPTNPNIKFFRSPETNTFPGQPGELEVFL